jgi:hypothetical protein
MGVSARLDDDSGAWKRRDRSIGVDVPIAAPPAEARERDRLFILDAQG